MHGDTDMQRRHGQAARTITCRTDMGHTTRSWACSMDMKMQHGHGHPARTCKSNMYMDIHYQHRNEYGHAVWTHDNNVDTDMDKYGTWAS